MKIDEYTANDLIRELYRRFPDVRETVHTKQCMKCGLQWEDPKDEIPCPVCKIKELESKLLDLTKFILDQETLILVRKKPKQDDAAAEYEKRVTQEEQSSDPGKCKQCGQKWIFCACRDGGPVRDEIKSEKFTGLIKCNRCNLMWVGNTQIGANRGFCPCCHHNEVEAVS